MADWGVFLAYTSCHEQMLIDWKLNLLQSWTNNLTRHAAAAVPCAWVTGDSVYSSDYALRPGIERHGPGYIMSVTSAWWLGLRPVAD